MEHKRTNEMNVRQFNNETIFDKIPRRVRKLRNAGFSSVQQKFPSPLHRNLWTPPVFNIIKFDALNSPRRSHFQSPSLRLQERVFRERHGNLTASWSAAHRWHWIVGFTEADRGAGVRSVDVEPVAFFMQRRQCWAEQKYFRRRFRNGCWGDGGCEGGGGRLVPLDGTLIVLDVVQVRLGLQKVAICGFVDDALDVLLHLVEQVGREYEILVLQAGLDDGAHLLRHRQLALLKEAVNGADDLFHLLAVALLLQAFTREIEIQSVAVNAAFLLDVLLEQLDAVAVLQQAAECTRPLEAWRRRRRLRWWRRRHEQVQLVLRRVSHLSGGTWMSVNTFPPVGGRRRYLKLARLLLTGNRRPWAAAIIIRQAIDVVMAHNTLPAVSFP